MVGGVGAAVSPDEARFLGECEQGTIRWVWFIETAVPRHDGERGVFPDGAVGEHGVYGDEALGVAGELENIDDQNGQIPADSAGRGSGETVEILVVEDFADIPVPKCF